MPRSLRIFLRDECQATVTVEDDGTFRLEGPGADGARPVVNFCAETARQSGADLFEVLKARVRGLHWWVSEGGA